MCVSHFYEYKTTKKHCCEQKIKEMFSFLKLFW